MSLEDLARIAKSKAGFSSEYLSEGRRNLPRSKSLLVVGRHWNSDSPAVPGNRTTPNADVLLGGAVGGGYYVQHCGLGVAVDPGHAFLKMLYLRHQVTLADIDFVIFTHNHPDHIADIANIVTIARLMNANRINGPPRMPMILAPPPVISHVLLHGDLPYRTILPGTRVLLNEPFLGAEALELTFLPALHWQTITRPALVSSGLPTFLDYHLSAVGLQIRPYWGHPALRPQSQHDGPFRSIVITSDTMFPVFDDDSGDFLPEAYALYLERQFIHLGLVTPANRAAFRRMLFLRFAEFYAAYNNLNVDLLCAHIGSVENQFGTVAPGSPLNFQYPGYHLGFLGALRLSRLLAYGCPRLVVLTEWGEELQGERKNLTRFFADSLSSFPNRHAVRCLPSDVDLAIELQHGLVGCSLHGRMHDYRHMGAVEDGAEYLRFESEISSSLAGDYEETCDWSPTGWP